MNLRFRRGNRFGERDFSPFLERGAALVGDFQHAELFRSLVQEAEPHQFAADGGPFRPVVLLADAVGRKLLVTPFANLLRVRAGEDLDHMVQADAEALLFADAINAGEKFLRGECAVERGAR